MRRPIAALLVLSLAGCQLNRPGEISPQRLPPGCAELETIARVTPLEDLSEEQLEQLQFCQAMAAAEHARATESHADYLADMSYLNLIIGFVAAAVTIIATVADDTSG